MGGLSNQFSLHNSASHPETPNRHPLLSDRGWLRRTKRRVTAIRLRVGEVTGVQYRLRAGNPVPSHDTLVEGALASRITRFQSIVRPHWQIPFCTVENRYPPCFWRTSPLCSWPPYDRHECLPSQQVTFATQCFVKSIGTTLSFLTTLHDLPSDTAKRPAGFTTDVRLTYLAHNSQVRSTGHNPAPRSRIQCLCLTSSDKSA